MLRCGSIVFLLLISVSSARADMVLTLDLISNQTTGYIEWKNSGQSSFNRADVYITQFQMNYQPSSGPSKTIYTYCVDLNDTETYKSYSVTAAPLNGPAPAFGTMISNEIGYLYSKYGTGNLQGKAFTDAALQ